VGSYNASSEKETIGISEGYGLLNVTQKESLFKGKGTVTINANPIVGLEHLKNAGMVDITSGKHIRMNRDRELTFITISVPPRVIKYV
jgi:hypothetical protein